ncbi:amidohydrolase family protein [Sphingomonas donggukensis]|uniref:Amidohydrolase family protein n=1 Tax=Sphingomonas donggukensis TaxID=2949093 RepID=A0ABY4TR78_9SPHN|nr:amidohydrolase family protein [Sphingomonas donggukensis]URW74891.1 amidohydrolase family protein [Sphingomonas donggukensis]
MKALLLAAAALIATPAAAQTIAITGGTVAIGDGSAPIENGTVVLRDGRIVAAGAGVSVPAGAQVVDARGKWVTAGMTAGIGSLGLVDAGGVQESNDSGSRQSPYNASIDVSVAINPDTVMIANERVGGVTRAIVAPDAGGSIWAGQGAVIDLGADPSPLTKPRVFQYVELGEGGARNAGGSRPAAYAALHDALAQAADYARAPGSFDGRSKDAILTRADAAALLKVLDGSMPLVVHVERASDIRQVLTLPTRYPRMKLIITGAAEGWMVAREIAAARVPVMASALADLPASFEKLAATESNVGRMIRAGVTVGILYDGSGGEHVLKQFAGNLVAIQKVPGSIGLSWGEAFAAITSKPAEVVGMGSEIGSLRPGRRADVVVWDGDPLELASAPTAVWIDGQPQPMDSRQRQLRNRYLNVVEGALPKAYDR